MRRLSSHYMLGAKVLQGWTDVREQEIRLMVRDIHVASNRGLPVAVPDMLSCSLANIMSQMALSMRVFMPEEDPELSNRFKHIVEELLELARLFNVGDFIPAVAFMDLQGIEGRMRRAHDKFDRFLDEMIERHTATAHDRVGKPDFLDMLMAGGCDGDYSDDQSLSPMNIKGLLLDLFIAGTDTASSTIEWALSELMLNPRILSRAREEMDRTIGRDRLLRESDLPNLPYLRAVWKETLRKHPSTPLIPRLAAKNCQVEGYDIPRGTRLTVNVWAIGRDPEAWEDPLVFLPERFLGGGKGSEIGPWGTDFELIPFGAGRRVCAGMRLGMVLVEYVVGTLVHAFKWRMLPVAAVEAAEVNMEERFGLTLQKAVPLSAITSPRLFPSAYEKS
ncbi:hypothetical protein SAY87_018320 [Trapa incisa]|uniref:Flavonoid 3',5'-hydroxylase n=1 Tax=Trapa incisa TaxID=236973 RepID=A0AAN7L874_9MYRT|nr:hypothetical protein SAY87_018320 [Trapa incisa]